MIPTQDPKHVAEGQGLLTSRYADKKVVKGLVTALMLRMQEIENDFFAMIDAVQLSNHPMPGGPWDVLDKIGTIVGGQAATRNGLDDADYLARIKLQASVNRSRGTPDDVIKLGALMAAPEAPYYLEGQTAEFYLGCWNIALKYPLFADLIKQARAAGVYGHLAYTTWVDGNDFRFSSRYDSANTGQGTWGSRRDANAGGLWVAAVNL